MKKIKMNIKSNSTFNNKMTSKKVSQLFNLLEQASKQRIMIENNHNGKHKLGCIIFDSKLNKQCVL